MVFHGGRILTRYLMLSAILALLFLSSFWLPQGGVRDCEGSWHPCLSVYHLAPDSALLPDGRNQNDRQMKERAGLSPVQPLPQECPGQSFQTRRLLLYLQASLGANDDVLLEPYLHSWEELIKFMESLGTIVSFFSQKIKDKVAVIRELSLKHSRETDGKRGLSDLSGLQIPSSLGLQELQLQNGAYRSVGSMVEVELQMGVVDFYRRSQSGCRTLLRLHRSLQWLKLLLEGLAEGPNSAGQYRTPGELCREAYLTALAPHHPWLIRQAAELVFVSLPERALFLQLVCVGNQAEAKPILHTLADALSLVHTRTQRILEGNHMLELP